MGWTLLSDEPWYFWGNEYNMHGAMGHGGSNPGSRSSMWFVEGEKDSYGIIIMTNHKETFKPDYGVYFYSIYAKIQELLLTEAYERYTLIS